MFKKSIEKQMKKRYNKWLRKKRKLLKKTVNKWNPCEFNYSFNIFMTMMNYMGEYYFLGDNVFGAEIAGHDRLKNLLKLQNLYYEYNNGDGKLKDVLELIEKESYFWVD